MLPDDNSLYNKLEYWEERYETEDHYDWFPSVYVPSLEAIFSHVEEVFHHQQERGTRNKGEVLRVLHLGTGNSSLVSDLYDLYEKRYNSNKSHLNSNVTSSSLEEEEEEKESAPYLLVQVAVDYSPTVIEKMKQKHSALSNVFWRVADIRNLSDVRSEFPSGFDVIVDKGTMDALQADKDNDSLDEDIAAMLREVSLSFDKRRGYAQFLQITWEVPLYRLHYTLGRDEGYPYAWQANEKHRLLGDSDMYRLFSYEVNP